MTLGTRVEDVGGLESSAKDTIGAFLWVEFRRRGEPSRDVERGTCWSEDTAGSRGGERDLDLRFVVIVLSGMSLRGDFGSGIGERSSCKNLSTSLIGERD